MTWMEEAMEESMGSHRVFTPPHIEREKALGDRIHELEQELDSRSPRRDLNVHVAYRRYDYDIVVVNVSMDLDSVRASLQKWSDAGWELMGVPVCVKSDIYTYLWYHFRRPRKDGTT